MLVPEHIDFNEPLGFLGQTDDEKFVELIKEYRSSTQNPDTYKPAELLEHLASIYRSVSNLDHIHNTEAKLAYLDLFELTMAHVVEATRWKGDWEISQLAPNAFKILSRLHQLSEFASRANATEELAHYELLLPKNSLDPFHTIGERLPEGWPNKAMLRELAERIDIRAIVPEALRNARRGEWHHILLSLLEFPKTGSFNTATGRYDRKPFLRDVNSAPARAATNSFRNAVDSETASRVVESGVDLNDPKFADKFEAQRKREVLQREVFSEWAATDKMPSPEGDRALWDRIVKRAEGTYRADAAERTGDPSATPQERIRQTGPAAPPSGRPRMEPTPEYRPEPKPEPRPKPRYIP